MKLSLCRQLRVLNDGLPTPAVRPTIVVASQTFHGPDFHFPPGENRDVTISMDLPRDEILSVRKTISFAVDSIMRVQADCGIMT